MCLQLSAPARWRPSAERERSGSRRAALGRGARVHRVRLECSGKGLGQVGEQGSDRLEGGLGERGLGEEVRGSEEMGFSRP